jgi:hypothetical protein
LNYRFAEQQFITAAGEGNADRVRQQIADGVDINGKNEVSWILVMSSALPFMLCVNILSKPQQLLPSAVFCGGFKVIGVSVNSCCCGLCYLFLDTTTNFCYFYYYYYYYYYCDFYVIIYVLFHILSRVRDELAGVVFLLFGVNYYYYYYYYFLPDVCEELAGLLISKWM